MYKMPYTLAKRILKQKYHATQEEIALWIETKEIIPKDAWVITTVGKKEKELYRWDGLSSYEPKDLTSKLSGLYFNGDEINKFVPKVRWISFNQIVERWTAHGESIDETVATLKNFIGVYPKDEEIKNGKNLQKYQYPLVDIEEIEKKLFPVLSETKTENEFDDIETPQSATETKENTVESGINSSSLYEKRKISFDTWLNASPKKLDDFETVEAIFEAVKKTGDTYKYKNKNDKLLWGIKHSTFTHDFWQKYYKETDYRRKKPQ
jgi:hypothetical protein